MTELTPDQHASLAANLSDQEWRLNNLYKIVDRPGNLITFKLNAVQEEIRANMHFRNVCLKSRQHGVTTFWLMFMLDSALFNEHLCCAVISDRLEDSKKFMQRIKLAYENLPESVRNHPKAKITVDNSDFIKLANGSSIASTVTMRSGTTHILHVSEFGITAYKRPQRAEEILSGALNSVPKDGIVSFESTAKGGAAGEFFKMWSEAEPNRKVQGRDVKLRSMPASGLSRDKVEYPKIPQLMFRPFFFGWFEDPGNRVPWCDVPAINISPAYERYFKELEDAEKITLDDAQRAWYVLKDRQEPDMRREHPSTAMEAWESSYEGLFYAATLSELRERGRICKVAFHPGYRVDTWWDLGVDDYTSLIFTQTIAREIRVIDFYENSDRGLRHYVDKLEEWSQPEAHGGKGYRYRTHTVPHDIRVREIGSDARTRQDILADMGVRAEVAPRSNVADGIEATRNIMHYCLFDEERCADLLDHLQAYRKQWDEQNQVYKDKPVHDKHSHAADAMRLLGLCHKFESHQDHALPVQGGQWSTC